MDAATGKQAFFFLDKDGAPVRHDSLGDARLYRNPEGHVPDLPAGLASKVRYLNQQHTTFFRASGRDATIQDLGPVADTVIQAGKKLFDELAPSLTSKAVIESLIGPAFTSSITSTGVDLRTHRINLTRFCFEAWKKEQSLGQVISNSMLLLGDTYDKRCVWLSPPKLWLGTPYPNGRDIDLLLRGLPEVLFLSGMYFDGLPLEDHEQFALFAGAVGVRRRVIPAQTSSSWHESQWQTFVAALGRPDWPDPGNCNRSLIVTDSDWPSEVKAALSRATGDGLLPVQRTSVLQAFSRVLEDSWPSLKRAKTRVGTYHVAFTRDDTDVNGGPSALATWLQQGKWVPVRGRPTLLLQPNQCALPSVENEKFAAFSAASIADIELTNPELIQFLGFSTAPPEISTLNQLRAEARSGAPVNLDRVIALYRRLAQESADGAGSTELREAFRAEPLIYLPTNGGLVLNVSRVVWQCSEDFEGYIQPLASTYEHIEGLRDFFTQRVGVPETIEDPHYVRYLVRHVWASPDDPVSEVRRRTILKTYRILIRWAASGMFEASKAPIEVTDFLQSTRFRGDSGGRKAWHLVAGKTVVYRDDLALAELLTRKDQFILESFLSQIDRAEDALEPFLRATGIRRASEVVKAVLRHNPLAAFPKAAAIRANLVHCLQGAIQGLRHLAQADDRRDEQASRVETSGRELAATAGAGLPVLLAPDLTRIYRIEGLPDRDVPISAALLRDARTAQLQLFLAEADCLLAGPDLAREICVALGTSELTGRIGDPVNEFVQELARFLDNPTDHFLTRLRQATRRYFPGIESEALPSDDQGGIAQPGESGAPSLGGSADVVPDGGHAPAPPPGGGGDPSPGPDSPGAPADDAPELPPISEQAAFIKTLGVDDFAAPQPLGGGSSPPWRDPTWKPHDPKWDRKIGDRAELLVVRHEKLRLRDEGHPNPDSVVDHVSARDAGSPFDILSVMLVDGIWEPLYIEVKGSVDSNAESFRISSGEWALAINPTVQHRIYHVRGILGTTPEICVIDLRELFLAKRVAMQNDNFRVRLRPSSKTRPDTGD